MKLNLNTKLLPIVIFSLLISVSTLTVVSINEISNVLNKMSWESLDVTDQSIKSRLDDYMADIRYISLHISGGIVVKEAVKNGDLERLRAVGESVVNDKNNHVDTVVFVSKDGEILAEVYNEPKLKIDISAKHALKKEEYSGISSFGNESLYLHSEYYIERDGGIVGAVIVGADIFSDNTFANDVKQRFNSEYTIFLGDVRYGTTLVNEAGVSLRGTKFTDSNIKEKVFVEGEKLNEELNLPGFKLPFLTSYAPLLDADGKIIGMRMVANSTETRAATIRNIVRTSLLVAIFCILLFGAINWFVIGRVLVKPIKVLTGLCSRLENLDLTQDADIKSSDELGELSHSVNSFVATIRKMLIKLQEQACTVGAASEELAVVTKTLQESTVQTANKVQDAVTDIGDMNQCYATAKKALEEVSSSIITISSSAEEMTATIGEIANNSSNARNITAEATDEAVKASGMIKNLGEAAEEISTVTESISNISAQTNILALNATIEAARAGAAGKGFAVVANEIKNLAQETESATGNIHGKVNDIQSSTSVAVNNVESVTKVINDVNNIVTSIAAAIEEQSAVTKDISCNIGNISDNIQSSNATIANIHGMTSKITEDINAVGKLAEGIATGSTQIKASADDLSVLSHELKGSVDQFKL